MPIFQQIITKASEDRLEKLISDRLKKGSNKEEIDARIWDLFGETWAVMFTDLSGFSRNVAKFGIIHFIQIIYESHRLLIPCIDNHDGILLKKEGDSMLIIFRRAERAIDCAIQMQKVLEEYNNKIIEEEKVLLCIGIGYGLLLKIGDGDVFGGEVNAASKLGEDTAKAGEILVTESMKDALFKRKNLGFEKIEIVPPGAKAAYRLKY
ncbi:MAG: adenylate/guanylate cyclase domain-containing protein [Desulfobacterales bacterium]|nr:adenylate/guanylate cyclase domain-containing protein [Desulfobacterales bacterium]MBF0396782.1 adenylate/guanylate cyclase domain-containing protein [Desulfobacterales bacterium]